MAIVLPKETRDRALASIVQFCTEELEIEAGTMKATLILDFLLKEIGPSIYNAGVADARAYVEKVTGDLDGACYEKEFTWRNPPGPPSRRGR
jgi:uncharacterized protein (DUF2164 family)